MDLWQIQPPPPGHWDLPRPRLDSSLGIPLFQELKVSCYVLYEGSVVYLLLLFTFQWPDPILPWIPPVSFPGSNLALWYWLIWN